VADRFASCEFHTEVSLIKLSFGAVQINAVGSETKKRTYGHLDQ
jgi:hypothetical protein